MPKSDWDISKIFDLPKADSILDVACGLSLKSKFFDADIRVGVDIYDEYFKHIESDVPYVTVRYDVRRLLDIFQENSFDYVIALDIIEHLTKEESLRMIEDLEKIAKKAVILETPKGYVPQNIDILGHGGHEFQTHRCGWDVDELQALGYTVLERSYTMSDVKRHTDIDVQPEITILEAIKWLES